MESRQAVRGHPLSGLQVVLGYRWSPLSLPPVGVLPNAYVTRRLVRIVRRVFGPVYPAYLLDPLWMTPFGVSALVYFVWRYALPPPAVLIPVAILCLTAGIIAIFHDGSLVPAPIWMSPAEAKRIVNRLVFFHGPLSLAFIAVGIGWGVWFGGWVGLAAAGAFFILGLSAGFVWIFLSSRLRECLSCAGLTVHRAARGRWICLRCRRDAGA